jgi:dTDP-glucose 4,6-dehydratase
VNGDGTPLRSYLYADDLVVWLFNLLENGRAGKVYNVGSDDALSIALLAQKVADTLAPGLPVKIMQNPPPNATGKPYVPDITASREAGLSSQSTKLADAIKLSAGITGREKH